MKLVLASASPRRRDLLRGAGFVVEVRPASIDETPRTDEEPLDLVERLAREKALAVEAGAGELLVAADTIVLDGSSILGKPRDPRHAGEMLRSLSGHEHRVITGYCLRRRDEVRARTVTSHVLFRALTEPEIAYYVETGEPLDKAGAYGIQGLGGALVESVRGSYTNVVGLPLTEVVEEIRLLSAT